MQFTPSGKHSWKSCLPVQSALGFNTAGIGIRPSHLILKSIRFMKSAFSMKVSRFVSFRTAVSVSWTIPITGRFDCGVTTSRGTSASCNISARVSMDCGT